MPRSMNRWMLECSKIDGTRYTPYAYTLRFAWSSNYHGQMPLQHRVALQPRRSLRVGWFKMCWD